MERSFSNSHWLRHPTIYHILLRSQSIDSISFGPFPCKLVSVLSIYWSCNWLSRWRFACATLSNCCCPKSIVDPNRMTWVNHWCVHCVRWWETPPFRHGGWLRHPSQNAGNPDLNGGNGTAIVLQLSSPAYIRGKHSIWIWWHSRILLGSKSQICDKILIHFCVALNQLTNRRNDEVSAKAKSEWIFEDKKNKIWINIRTSFRTSLLSIFNIKSCIVAKKDPTQTDSMNFYFVFYLLTRKWKHHPHTNIKSTELTLSEMSCCHHETSTSRKQRNRTTVAARNKYAIEALRSKNVAIFSF